MEKHFICNRCCVNSREQKRRRREIKTNKRHNRIIKQLTPIKSGAQISTAEWLEGEEVGEFFFSVEMINDVMGLSRILHAKFVDHKKSSNLIPESSSLIPESSMKPTKASTWESTLKSLHEMMKTSRFSPKHYFNYVIFNWFIFNSEICVSSRH